MNKNNDLKIRSAYKSTIIGSVKLEILEILTISYGIFISVIY